MTALHWTKRDYFDSVMRCDESSTGALEMMVDDLHLDRDKTVQNFLNHNGSEDFLWALVKLLSSKDVRTAGNAAYILGMLAESELGCYRILDLMKKNTIDGTNPLLYLLNMLQSSDAESVMNAAGTIGTLAETCEGRDWMLGDETVATLLSRMTALLDNANMWTASNAALVLARLTISMLGSGAVLNHMESQTILSKLIQSLGLDEAGRGMNAAFAIGRLCDLDAGRNRLLGLVDADQMILSLSRMLSCTDTGASKNACFALSCLAATPEGHARLLNSCDLDLVLVTLTGLLLCGDAETSWFAAMTVRTIASQPAGCLRLRDSPKVIQTLRDLIANDEITGDLRDEIMTTLDILKRLGKPDPPTVTVTGGHSVHVAWSEVLTKSGFLVKYQLFEGARLVFLGSELSTTLSDLQPATQYSYRVRAFTEADESPLSDNVLVTTDEAAPSAPTQFRVIGATTTQLKLIWEPPQHMNGTLKGYYVYCEKKLFEHTQELTSIVTGLTPATEYNLSVCAATSKGKGEKTVTSGTTSELGAHAPARPVVNVIGRNEVSVSWEMPDNPLGKINRYDLTMNGRVIYSGTDYTFTVHRLQPDTEYTFVVSALTNEGRCESKPTKKRTSKDEFDDSTRAPLYTAPGRRDSTDGPTFIRQPRRTPLAKRRKSTTDVKASRVASAKAKGDDNENKRPTSRKVTVQRRASLQPKKTDIQEETPPETAAKPEDPPPPKPPIPDKPPPAVSQSEPSTKPEPITAPKTDDVKKPSTPPDPAPVLGSRSYTTLTLHDTPLTRPRPSPDPSEGRRGHTASRSHSIPSDFMKRANTFAGNHRPSIQRNMNRHLASSARPLVAPVGPSSSRPLPAHLSTKFVPMQVRTQPANLPQNLRRALSNVKVTPESGQVQLRNLDARSTTQLDLKRMSIENEIERLAVGSRRVRDHRAERSTEEIFNKSFTGYRYPSPRGGDQHNPPVQSAR